MWSVAGDVEELSVQAPESTASETVSPELAVASMPKSASPKVASLSAPKAIVLPALSMLNVCGTSAAGLKSRFPGCDAVIVQLPAPVRWTFAPVTVQLPLAAYETARAELEVAPSAKSGSPKVRPASGAKVSVWFCLTAESGSCQT